MAPLDVLFGWGDELSYVLTFIYFSSTDGDDLRLGGVPSE